MFKGRSELFRKKIVYLIVGLSGIAILIFWKFTYAPQDRDAFGELNQSKIDLEERLEEHKDLRENSLQEISKASEEIFGEDEEDVSAVIEERDIVIAQEKKGLVLEVLNIVFKEEETWVYLALANSNDTSALMRSVPQGQVKIVQGEQDYPEEKAESLFDYPLPDTIAPQSEVMGALHFPGIDPGAPFILFIGGVRLEDEQEHFNYLFKIQ